MKKIITTLAVFLAIFISIVFTSCNDSDLVIEEPAIDHEVTVTISFPSQSDVTRVGIDNNLKLTGWAINDEVTLVKVISEDSMHASQVKTGTFRCIDAENGTFSGVLPDGIENVSDMDIAVYNGKNFHVGETSYLCFEPKKYASSNIEDVIMMTAKYNNGFNMKITGSILKVTNNSGAVITASVKNAWQNYWVPFKYYEYYDGSIDPCTSWDFPSITVPSFTLSTTQPTYVFIPCYNDYRYTVGLYKAEDGDKTSTCSVVSSKRSQVDGRMYTITL